MVRIVFASYPRWSVGVRRVTFFLRGQPSVRDREAQGPCSPIPLFNGSLRQKYCDICRNRGFLGQMGAIRHARLCFYEGYRSAQQSVSGRRARPLYGAQGRAAWFLLDLEISL